MGEVSIRCDPGWNCSSLIIASVCAYMLCEMCQKTALVSFVLIGHAGWPIYLLVIDLTTTRAKPRHATVHPGSEVHPGSWILIPRLPDRWLAEKQGRRRKVPRLHRLFLSCSPPFSISLVFFSLFLPPKLQNQNQER